jgi:flagellar motor switch protein FliG
MKNISSKLRQAAVLIRSLDADSAARLLAQLSSAEAEQVREAMRSLGPIDPDEQQEVLAEFRRLKPLVSQPATRGVELALSEPTRERPVEASAGPRSTVEHGRRFDFLENAPVSVLVGRLSREHAQTVAVVLAHLAPSHAARVLAALPESLQGKAIERLSLLGETDIESIAALESELAAWDSSRVGGREERVRRREAMAAILAAADSPTREAILKRISPDSTARTERGPIAGPRADRSFADAPAGSRPSPTYLDGGAVKSRPARSARTFQRDADLAVAVPLAKPERPVQPCIEFDHLIYLDDVTLAAVLREVDSKALALALAGSSDKLIDRICAQMPKRTAKVFRRELHRLGPTRLSDVEAAQRLVAHAATARLAATC